MDEFDSFVPSGVTEEMLQAHALTVVQPFATAIMLECKKVENRSWEPTLPHGGRWFFRERRRPR